MNSSKYEDDSVVSKLVSELAKNGLEVFGHRSHKEKVACNSITLPSTEEKRHNPQTAKVDIVTFKKVIEKGFPSKLSNESYPVEIVNFPQSGLMEKFTQVYFDNMEEVLSSTAKDGSSFNNTDEVVQKIINRINTPQQP